MLEHVIEPLVDCKRPNKLIYLVGPVKGAVSVSNLYSVLNNEPDNRQAKLRLAEVYEVQNDPKKALALVYEGSRFPLLLSTHLT